MLSTNNLVQSGPISSNQSTVLGGFLDCDCFLTARCQQPFRSRQDDEVFFVTFDPVL